MQQPSPMLTANRTPIVTTRVLRVGDWMQPEFAASLLGLPAAEHWATATDLNHAYDYLNGNEQPVELILLAQPLPDQYDQQEVDRLQQLVPLARIVLVVGSWCEGELRNGSPPEGVIRLYWYDLAPWWQAATLRRDAGLCPLWSLPLDHPQAGRWAIAKEVDWPQHSSASVLIDTQDFEVYQTLSAAFTELGLSSSWTGTKANGNSQSPCNAGIWDGGQLSDREVSQLADFCRRVSGPVVALLDFPRIQHLEQAKAAGAVAVFAKPYIVEELVAAFTIRPTQHA